LRKASSIKTGISTAAELIDWFNGGSERFSKGTEVTVIDVDTGLSFRGPSVWGEYHADSEFRSPPRYGGAQADCRRRMVLGPACHMGEDRSALYCGPHALHAAYGGSFPAMIFPVISVFIFCTARFTKTAKNVQGIRRWFKRRF
jgi:hypothetical protein